MNPELASFAARLRRTISYPEPIGNEQFNSLALELFALQFQNNIAYRIICEARRLTPETVRHWTQIAAVPTGIFKELELTSLVPDERTTVFHSSGTTEQKPSRHFHCAESLALYETSLWQWFQRNCRSPIADCQLVCLTPLPEKVPHSSLVHMFDTIRPNLGGSKDVFTGRISADGGWTLDFDATLAELDNSKLKTKKSKLVFGTAFSFVHLLDFLAEKRLRIRLPEKSSVMETGGYKNRSRSMPKAELHALIEEYLGVPRENIICEYGMSELSSQAYEVRTSDFGIRNSESRFLFPPWARVQIISPETGREVGEGGTGLIRIFDLANVFSVAAVQTEDLGVQRCDGFELVGRAQSAEPRGCSLMIA